MQRLSKFIAAAGVASRRKAGDLVRAGRVRVDGEVVTEPGTLLDPARSRVEVDGRAVEVEPKVYVLLNKPRGPISAAVDRRGRSTVLDLIGDLRRRAYPAGRLDADTEGLLLITNDGELTYRLTHPRFEVEKVYVAEVEGRPSRRALDRLAGGVMLADGPAPPARVRMLRAAGRGAALEITVHSGRKRMVRRMLETVGHAVISLKRIRVGPLELGDLRPGDWRELTAAEVASLKEYAERRAARG